MPEKETFSDLNGINGGRLYAVIESIDQADENAHFELRTHNRWVNGAHCFSKIKDFKYAGREYTNRAKLFIVDADEPDVLLGTDYGPNATEWALHALAGCLNTTFIYHASMRAVNVHELIFDVEGGLDIRGFLGLDENIRPGFQWIRVRCAIEADASEEELRELVDIARRHSPVFDSIAHGVPVTVEVVSADEEKAA